VFIVKKIIINLFSYFRLIYSLILLQLSNKVASEKILSCEYGTGQPSFWPEIKHCLLSGVDLSLETQSQEISFTGTEIEKSGTTGIRFQNCLKTVDFLPPKIVSEFPALRELIIWHSNIPILKNGFFSDAFENLLHIDLWRNNIVTIEEHAFSKLPKLKWIWLSGNKLESIEPNIFANNQELEVIWLAENNIKTLSPRLFDLSKLKVLDFTSNDCANKFMGCETCLISETDLNICLKNCWIN
jgi:hypothetical protein